MGRADLASVGGVEDRPPSVDVLEHVPSPLDCLRDLSKVLAGNGRIVIAVPNSSYWAGRILKQHWHSTDVPRHVQQFTLESIHALASRAGFLIERRFTYSLPKGVGSSIRQALRRKLAIPGRFTSRLGLIDRFGEKILGPWLDRQAKGEAIIAWLRREGV